MPSTPACPECQSVLVIMSETPDHWNCTVCEVQWKQDGDELCLVVTEEIPPSRLQRFLRYTISLPERTLRTTVGLTAGAARELAAALVPASFQNSKSYELVVKKSLQFLTESVGGVKSPQQSAEQEEEDYLARKVVGNFVELAGLSTLQVSPIWLLAIISDLAYGSKSYLQELAKELQQQGLIKESSSIHKVDDLLDAIQNSSGHAASMFDTPPLSVAELRESLQKTREALAAGNVRDLIPQAKLQHYWEEMRSLAVKENVSLLNISSAITLYAMGKVKTVSQGGLVGLRVAGGLLQQHVLAHYRDGLVRIREKGYYTTIRETALPYVHAVWSNFSHETPMLTERLVDGTFWRGAWGKVRSIVSRKEKTPPLLEAPDEEPEIVPPDKKEPEEVPPDKTEPDEIPSHKPEPPRKGEPKMTRQNIMPLLDVESEPDFLPLDFDQLDE